MEHGFAIPFNFVQTAPIYYGSSNDGYDGTVAVRRGNNQTDRFLALLDLQPTITIPFVSSKGNVTNDPNELDLDGCSFVFWKQQKPLLERCNHRKGSISEEKRIHDDVTLIFAT